MPDEVNNNEGNFTDITIRDQLVNTAVNFLLNPDVQKRHNDNKIEFLRKKGLTEAEITAAFERAKFDSRNANTFASPNHLKNSHPALPPYEPYSFWSRLSGISSSLIVFGVAIYGLHYFYKKYIKPWFLGVEAEKDALTENIMVLSDKLNVLTDTVSKLHTIVAKQNEEINKLVQIEGSSYAPTPMILEDLKREVSSLKSILISRHQFPAIPQMQPVRASIPSWQLPTCQNQLMQQSGEVPESSYGTNGTAECLTTTGTLDLKTTEVKNSIDPNFHFGQNKEASADGGDDETPTTNKVDEA